MKYRQRRETMQEFARHVLSRMAVINRVRAEDRARKLAEEQKQIISELALDKVLA